MAYYIFDLDGTLANIDHRRDLLPNWDAFFEACDQDALVIPVADILWDLFHQGHRVEIWSGRSAKVEAKTRAWLVGYDIDPNVLARMRPEDDFRPDEVLKASWLAEERAAGNEPAMIFDDRQKVVDMWRREGVVCAQVAPGDFDKPKQVQPHVFFQDGTLPLLTLMVGPSGAGKTSYLEGFEPQMIVSSDGLRACYALDFRDQSVTKKAYNAMEQLVELRMRLGLPTVVDATNIRDADRKTIARLTPAGHRCAYVVLNRSVEEKNATAGWRAPVKVRDESLIDYHERIFRSNEKAIRRGDGFDFVDVHTPNSYKALWVAAASRHEVLKAA